MVLKDMHLPDFNILIYLVITNEADKKNAYKIANLLLEEKLISCVTFKNIESSFWWEGKITQSKEVQLIIEDEGPGFNEKNIDKIFERFYSRYDSIHFLFS